MGVAQRSSNYLFFLREKRRVRKEERRHYSRMESHENNDDAKSGVWCSKEDGEGANAIVGVIMGRLWDGRGIYTIQSREY